MLDRPRPRRWQARWPPTTISAAPGSATADGRRARRASNFATTLSEVLSGWTGFAQMTLSGGSRTNAHQSSRSLLRPGNWKRSPSRRKLPERSSRATKFQAWDLATWAASARALMLAGCLLGPPQYLSSRPGSIRSFSIHWLRGAKGFDLAGRELHRWILSR